MDASTSLSSWPATCSALREILNIDSGPSLKCHSELKSRRGERCSRAISKPNIALISELLAEVVSKGSWVAARATLEKLSCLIMCKLNHQSSGEGQMKVWEKLLRPLKPLKIKVEEEKEAATSGELKNDKSWDNILQLLASISAKLKEEHQPAVEKFKLEYASDTPKAPPETPPRTSRRRSSSSVPISPSSSNLKTTGPKHTFESFNAPNTTINVNRKIKSLILRSLNQKESELRGSIYIYTFPTDYRSKQPFLKIGNTKQFVENRMLEWKRQCGYTPRVLSQYSVDHHVKVERLVHANLANSRKRELSCPGCGKTHMEWFDVQNCKAAETVALWADWMRMEPYDQEGVLRKAWRHRLEIVDLNDPECWKKFINGSEDEDETDSEADVETSEDSVWDSTEDNQSDSDWDDDVFGHDDEC